MPLPTPSTVEVKGWRVSGSEGLKLFKVEGYASVEAARTAVLASSPATFDGLSRVDDSIAATDESPSSGIFIIEVPYRRIGLPQIGGGVPRTLLTIDMQPGSVTKFQTPVADVTAFGAGMAAGRYQGFIGVNADGTVTGTEIEQSSVNFDANFTLPDNQVDQAFVDAIYKLSHPNHLNEVAIQMNIGSVAAPKYLNFPIRTLRFRGGRLSRGDTGQWNVTLALCAAAGISFALDYLDISGSSPGDQSTTVTMGGHDAVWFPAADAEVGTTTKALVRKPIGAFVHKVYPLAGTDGRPSFTALKIPAT